MFSPHPRTDLINPSTPRYRIWGGKTSAGFFPYGGFSLVLSTNVEVMRGSSLLLKVYKKPTSKHPITQRKAHLVEG